MPLRYVVLHHTEIDAPHFDFLFEMDPDAPLMSLRCPAWPPRVGDRLLELEPHRPLYLDYEGPISGSRGRVDRVDAGAIAFQVVLEEPLAVGLRLQGGASRELTITRDPDAAAARTDQWIVLTHLDQDGR